MDKQSGYRVFLFSIMLLVGCLLSAIPTASAGAAGAALSLSQAIEIALAADLSLKSSKEGIEAAVAAKKAQRAQFFPTFSTSYQYKHNHEGREIIPNVFSSQNEFTFATTVTQPIFTGYALKNQYDLTKIGLTIAEIQEKLSRQDVILKVKQAYFSVLKSQKLMAVAGQTVKQIEAQKNVAENFYQVGMTPLNDLLQAQVQLANVNQALIRARNNREIAVSKFNTVLRRPIDNSLELVDILEYSPFMYDLTFCLETAEKNRLEPRIANLQVNVAEKEIDLVKREHFPSVNLQGNYFRIGEGWDVDGGEGIFDPDGWYVTAVASWNFWEWGKTHHSVTEKRRRYTQAKYNVEGITDQVRLQVKEAYLRTKEAEENIKTVEKAIEQAKENFRINQERYKEQVATSTDVLDAQTLLSLTMTNYYNALYDFQLSKASLFRAMGREIGE